MSKDYYYLKRNNFKVRDEYYTPKILVEPILEYVKPNSTVWCPFDTEDSEFVIGLREQGHKVYHLKTKYDISPINKSDKDLYKHPTIKPLNMVKRHLEHATQEGDLIFDPFHGSGTVGEACRELGRDFIAFEIEKEYCDIANDRYNGVNANGQTNMFHF